MTNVSKISLEEYVDGHWSNDKLSSEEFYDQVTPKLHELIEEVKVKKLLSKIGDSYKKLVYLIKNNTAFEKLGIVFSRRDYYSTLKTYCLSLR